MNEPPGLKPYVGKSKHGAPCRRSSPAMVVKTAVQLPPLGLLLMACLDLRWCRRFGSHGFLRSTASQQTRIPHFCSMPHFPRFSAQKADGSFSKGQRRPRVSRHIRCFSVLRSTHIGLDVTRFLGNATAQCSAYVTASSPGPGSRIYIYIYISISMYIYVYMTALYLGIP